MPTSRKFTGIDDEVDIVRIELLVVCELYDLCVASGPKGVLVGAENSPLVSAVATSSETQGHPLTVCGLHTGTGKHDWSDVKEKAGLQPEAQYEDPVPL